MRFTKKGSQSIVVEHPATSLYQYQAGRQFQAGALSWAFDMLFGLPAILARGPSRIAGQLNVFPQAPQVFATLAVPVSGYGGLQTGNFTLNPLVDTTGDTSGL